MYCRPGTWYTLFMPTGHAGLRSALCLSAGHHSAGREGGGDIGLVGCDARTGLVSLSELVESERERLVVDGEQRTRRPCFSGDGVAFVCRGLRLSGLVCGDWVAFSCGGLHEPCFSGDGVAFVCRGLRLSGLVCGDWVAFSCGGLHEPCFSGDGVAFVSGGLRLGGLVCGDWVAFLCGGLRGPCFSGDGVAFVRGGGGLRFTGVVSTSVSLAEESVSASRMSVSESSDSESELEVRSGRSSESDPLPESGLSFQGLPMPLLRTFRRSRAPTADVAIVGPTVTWGYGIMN
jgi:hypothetical protein